ncbi:MAG: hypothetical protein LQ343_006416 [Gyalolechia ehrenbergii]|nr:MAG: hypothetical protein LQ343_006416 [Gyalolechia ehrenbergii]
MESLKNALGYGSQSGQEPISGEIGKGTADQPYDAGNVAGQSGASAAEVTSTNPTGTTQYDTGEDTNTSTVQDTTQNTTKTNTSETLAAGVTGGDMTSPSDDPATTQPAASTSGSVAKGDDQSRGPDEQVSRNKYQSPSEDAPLTYPPDPSRPGSDSNTNAQDAFFNKAHIAPDKPANPPKIPDPITNKDPFSSSSGAAPSNDTQTESSNEKSAPHSPPTNDTPGTSSLEKVGSSAPEKGYKTADTEPHHRSSEVLSSATPGAALDGPPQPSGSNTEATQPTSSLTGDSGTASTSQHDNTTTTTTDSGNTSTAPPTTTTTTTAAAADADYPSPKTQPSEAQGGLSGISHNTGNAPSAPETGSDAVEDPALGASQGQGKKKMGDRIKEKLHLGKKGHE